VVPYKTQRMGRAIGQSRLERYRERLKAQELAATAREELQRFILGILPSLQSTRPQSPISDDHHDGSQEQ
jgi:hypothetical protein